MDFGIICRVCMREGTMMSIFKTKTDGERKILCADMLIACATVRVSNEDNLPKQICLSCYKKLWSSYKFRQLCEKSYLCLLDLASKKSIIDEIKIEKSDETDFQSDVLDNVKLKVAAENGTSSSVAITIDDVKEECDVKPKKEYDGDIYFNDDDIFYDDRETSPFSENFITSSKSGVKREYVKKDKSKKKLKSCKKKLLKEENIERKKKKNGGFQCLFCPKNFKTSSRLLAHQDYHMGIKRYFCELCQKSYRSEKDHKGMHNRGFKFKCEICSKVFNTKSKLNIHIETHNENREKIVCGLNGCTKVFMTAGGLDRHRLFHDGLKNFICHLCSKSFIDKYLLEIHLRTHNNERRYACSYCEKRFIQSSARIAHERRHTNTKNYHCKECDKSFVCSSVLKRHTLCHSKINNEVCRFCGKRFSRLDNRKRHESVMHGVSDNVDENLL